MSLTAENLDNAWELAQQAQEENYPAVIEGDFLEQLITEVERLTASLDRVRELHQPVPFYDECECPDGTHPEEYEYVDVDEYVGCENSLIGYGCRHCCTHDDYTNEQCVHGEAARHDNSRENSCPTIRALDGEATE